VAGGARQYVEKIVARIPDRRLATPVRQVLRDPQGVRIITDGHVERFDAVVMACHSDQSLRLLGNGASQNEREVLAAIRYQPNRAVLHTDASVLPANARAWAAWNYQRAASADVESAQVCLHYLINRLQPLPVTQPVVVSLNPQRDISPTDVLGEYEYHHPVFDLPAIRAQARVNDMQGQRHTWFAGAWTGYGFHEDGLKSGLRAARSIIDTHGLVPMDAVDAVRRQALPGVFA
jgi:predicted NAD/FAD-binding protein